MNIGLSLTAGALALLGMNLASAPLTAATQGAKAQRGWSEEQAPGWVKVKLVQTPAAVQKTIRRELFDADLEDVAKKQTQGKTVYKVDIIKGSHKWEVVVGEEGKIISSRQEGDAADQAMDKMDADAAQGADAWRDTFNVN